VLLSFTVDSEPWIPLVDVVHQLGGRLPFESSKDSAGVVPDCVGEAVRSITTSNDLPRTVPRRLNHSIGDELVHFSVQAERERSVLVGEEMVECRPALRRHFVPQKEAPLHQVDLRYGASRLLKQVDKHPLPAQHSRPSMI